jgi:hypothetical protein
MATAPSRTSTLSWLAFSDEERRRAQDALGFFRERDTRDELGVASVRDAFSELLFPGTSTIQTRAAYFLFVPWIYRGLEQTAGGNSAMQAARAEQRLIVVLAESDDPEGTVGLRAGPDVQRLPSSIYWQGLHSWGIRRARAPLAAYHAWLDHPLRRRVERDDDGVPVDGTAQSAWDPELPDAPTSFPEGAGFALRPEHARYLRDRVMLSHPETMLAFLVDRGHIDPRTPYPWAHPQRASMPDGVDEILDHAELFSLAINGAALLYNLLAAEKAKRQSLADEFRSRLDDWTRDLDQVAMRIDAWSRGRFWELVRLGNPRVRESTRRFVDDWLRRVVETRGAGLVDDKTARAGIVRREIAIKGERSARLFSPSALALWNGDSGGAGRMSFRWPTVRTVVRDIRRGINARPD